jgi:hypothetical protein
LGSYGPDGGTLAIAAAGVVDCDAGKLLEAGAVDVGVVYDAG